jgi:hypothetical protein
MKNKIYSDEIKKQSWRQMNKMLDRELPVKNPKKLVVLLLLLLLALSVPALYWIAGNTEKEDAMEMKTPLMPEAIQTDSIISEKNGNYAGLENKTKEESELKAGILDEEKEQNKATGNNPGPVFSETKETEEQFTEIVAGYLSNNDRKEFYQSANQENAITPENRDHTDRGFSAVAALQTSRLIEGSTLLLYPVFDYSDKKPYSSFFNPFAKLSVFNSGSDDFSPGFGLYAGNSFYLSRRFFIDLSIGYTMAESLINTTSLVEYDKPDRSEFNAITLYQGNQDAWSSLSNGVAEISVMEGYHISRRFSLRAGGGVAFTNRLNKIIKSRSENILSNDEEITIATGMGKYITIKEGKFLPSHSFFAGISSSYIITEKLDLLLGYKHYFKSYNVVTDNKEANIYRASIDNPPFVSGIYIGMRYWILKK